MALTATALKSSWQEICRTLRMTHSKVVSVSPNKPNIKYTVVFNPATLEETFAPLVEEVHRMRMSMERVIIFCRTFGDCGMIFFFFWWGVYLPVTSIAMLYYSVCILFSCYAAIFIVGRRKSKRHAKFKTRWSQSLSTWLKCTITSSPISMYLPKTIHNYW